MFLDQINIDNRTNTQIANLYNLLAIKSNRGLKCAIIETYEKAQIEAKKNNEIQKKITKAIDVTITAKTLS